MLDRDFARRYSGRRSTFPGSVMVAPQILDLFVGVQVLPGKLQRPLRLVAQDVRFSFSKQGFDSPRGYFIQPGRLPQFAGFFCARPVFPFLFQIEPSGSARFLTVHPCPRPTCPEGEPTDPVLRSGVCPVLRRTGLVAKPLRGIRCTAMHPRWFNIDHYYR